LVALLNMEQVFLNNLKVYNYQSPTHIKNSNNSKPSIRYRTISLKHLKNRPMRRSLKKSTWFHTNTLREAWSCRWAWQCRTWPESSSKKSKRGIPCRGINLKRQGAGWPLRVTRNSNSRHLWCTLSSLRLRSAKMGRLRRSIASLKSKRRRTTSSSTSFTLYLWTSEREAWS
jgi:hypothetical protein